MSKKMDKAFKDLYDASLPVIEEKDNNNYVMWTIAKQLSGQTTIPQVSFIKYKDFLYYYGNGWMGDPLRLAPRIEEPYPDRTSKKFIAVLDIIEILRSINQIEALQPYLDAMEKRGIKITISPKEPIVEDITKYSSEIDSMTELQGSICELADIIKIDHANSAQGLNLCKKNHYPDLANSYKKVVSDKEHKQAKMREKLNKDIDDLKKVENRKEEIVHV